MKSRRLGQVPAARGREPGAGDQVAAPMTQPDSTFLQTLRSLPPLSPSTARVLAIGRVPGYSFDALASAVIADQVLTARVLGRCHRALPAQSPPLLNLADAVTRFGMREIAKLVLAVSAVDYFKGLQPNRYLPPGTAWNEALGCATTCQVIAEATGHEQPVTAFMAGILHDLGRAVLVRVRTADRLDAAAAELADPAADVIEVERRLLAVDHAAAIELAVESWNLPPELRRALRGHHQPAAFSAVGALAAILHVAELATATADQRPPHSAALRRLGLRAADLDAIRSRAEADLQRSLGLLNPEPEAGR
jgi:HD-like signal output (HDOD) protein